MARSVVGRGGQFAIAARGEVGVVFEAWPSVGDVHHGPRPITVVGQAAVLVCWTRNKKRHARNTSQKRLVEWASNETETQNPHANMHRQREERES